MRFLGGFVDRHAGGAQNDRLTQWGPSPSALQRVQAPMRQQQREQLRRWGRLHGGDKTMEEIEQYESPSNSLWSHGVWIWVRKPGGRTVDELGGSEIAPGAAGLARWRADPANHANPTAPEPKNSPSPNADHPKQPEPEPEKRYNVFRGLGIEIPARSVPAAPDRSRAYWMGRRRAHFFILSVPNNQPPENEGTVARTSWCGENCLQVRSLELVRCPGAAVTSPGMG